MNMSNTTSSSNKKSGRREDEISNAPVKKKKIMPNRKPNYFIGIHLADPVLKDVVVEMQKSISTTHPHLRKCLTSPNKLHLTCFVMELSGMGDVNAAVRCFMSCEPYINMVFDRHKTSTSVLTSTSCTTSASISTSSVTAEWSHKHYVLLNRMAMFGTKVLFIAPSSSSSSLSSSSQSPFSTLVRVASITSHLKQQFSAAGLFSSSSADRDRDMGDKGGRGASDWVPHCTIAKTAADRKNGR
jgi:hypothetical protein